MTDSGQEVVCLSLPRVPVVSQSVAGRPPAGVVRLGVADHGQARAVGLVIEGCVVSGCFLGWVVFCIFSKMFF